MREHSPSSSMSGLRSLSPHEIRHSPGDVRSRRVSQRSWPNVAFRLSRFFVPSRPVSKNGRSVSSVSHYATVATVAASQQWPKLVRDDTWNRQNVRPMRPSGKWGKPPASWSHAGVKVSVTLYTCIFQSSFPRSSIFFFFARFSFLFAFDFLFLGDFSMCSFNVFISCWNHVNNLMIKKCDYLKCLWRFWCFDKKSFIFK